MHGELSTGSVMWWCGVSHTAVHLSETDVRWVLRGGGGASHVPAACQLFPCDICYENGQCGPGETLQHLCCSKCQPRTAGQVLHGDSWELSDVG